MTKRQGSRRARASSSSKLMVAYERSDAVLALGKKLVAELKLGDTTDTLARWIIHYIAELIKKVERSTAKRKEKLARECFEAILVLWQHRHEMPDGKRPFEGLESALRALESLDPCNTEHRYFSSVYPPHSD